MKDIPLNVYPLCDLAHDIASDILTDPKSDLVRIPQFLGRKLLSEARLAQSIITRSEAELVGISSPRFATRVYLENGGFMNCRRLEQFIKNAPGNAPNEWGSRYPSIPNECRNPDLKSIQHTPPLISDIVRGQSCIADCLLSESERLRKYHVRYVDTAAARLFDVYGEPRTAHLDRRPYTPYVKSINFGGGLCAQAVCFMATSASQHATMLCGLAEITAFAHLDNCLELSLSGLTPARMQRYFDQVGLNMTEQAPSSNSKMGLSDIEKRELSMALRCYLHSNMPVIFPVDCRRMAALPTPVESIYLKNGFLVSQNVFPAEAPHAIILVGYFHHADQDVFVFHDPFVFPYMTAPLSKLSIVGCRRDGEPRIPDNGIFMPVSPSRVKLPLLWERRQDASGQTKTWPGLLLISKTLHVLLYNLTRPNSLSMGCRIPFLLSITAPTAEELLGAAQNIQTLIAEELRRCVQALHEVNNWTVPHWLWYELHANAVWIWDAELPPAEGLPETLQECLKYLCGVVRITEKNGTVDSVIIKTDG